VSAKLTALLSGLITAATLMVASAPALAAPRVEFGISIGAPGYYAAPAYVPAPVYAAPPVVYDPYYAYRARAWQERQLRRQLLREQMWRERQLRRHYWSHRGYW
jgi:hypothetical protein